MVPGESELGGTLEITMSDWGGSVPRTRRLGPLSHISRNPNGEPAALIATGRVDGVEMLRHAPFNHLEYYRYLNCGYRLPLVGGTDKMSSDVPVGIYRTYAYMPDQEFTYDNWCKSVSQGRTFHSGGPIIHLTADGHNIGDTMQLSGAGTVEVEAWAESIFPIHTLEIVQAGRVVASTEDSKGTRRLELKSTSKSGWTHLDCCPMWCSQLYQHPAPRRLGSRHICTHLADFMSPAVENGGCSIRMLHSICLHS